MNRLALTAGLAAMDLCWIFPWSQLLGLWSGGQLQPLLLTRRLCFDRLRPLEVRACCIRRHNNLLVSHWITSHWQT